VVRPTSDVEGDDVAALGCEKVRLVSRACSKLDNELARLEPGEDELELGSTEMFELRHGPYSRDESCGTWMSHWDRRYPRGSAIENVQLP
jgi:hypothetical protein